MNDGDDNLAINVEPGSGAGVVNITASIVTWNESNLIEIRDEVLVPFGLVNINIQPITISTKPTEVRITSSRDVAVAFCATMPVWMGRDFCKALIAAAMNRFMELNLSPSAIDLVGGREFFEGKKYTVAAP